MKKKGKEVGNEKVSGVSVDVFAEEMEKFRAVFPQFVRDGVIDFDGLKDYFTQNGFTDTDEKYRLGWYGRKESSDAIRVQSAGTLNPNKADSRNWDDTQNVFIEGDNLEVLKLLQARYVNKIDVIYIDPPYNRDGDFVYNDTFTMGRSDYYERTGQTKNGIKTTANTERNGHRHSKWLTMMFPRLFLAKQLLSQEGVIFISIDDTEQANLKMLCDEMFGEENFVANIIWQKKYTQSNDAKYFSATHDFILCYAKAVDNIQVNPLPRTDEQNARYTNPDDDPRGPWMTQPLHARSGAEINRYTFKFSNGQEYTPPVNRYWAHSVETLRRLDKENRIWFGANGTAVPRLKKYLSEMKEGVIPKTIWLYNEVGSNDSAAEMREIFDGNIVFDSPKPSSLIKHILKLTANNNGVVLDFFAGSGTTAHAVMALNDEDGGSRQCISVQMPEEVDKKSNGSYAFLKKLGKPLNIAEIAKERIRRAGDMMGRGDVGFKVFTLAPSNYTEWSVVTEEDGIEKLEGEIRLFADNPLISGYREEDIIYEVILKEGLSLTSEVERIDSGFKHYRVTDEDSHIFISFEKKVAQKDIENLKPTDRDIVVCFDSAVDISTTTTMRERGVKLKTI